MEISDRLRLHGLRYRLGLATCNELRQVAEEALNLGLYSPSLADAALDADEYIKEIGMAYEKALRELAVDLPESKDECVWEVLRYYINQIPSEEIKLKVGLARIYEVYNGCRECFHCEQELN